MGELSEEPSEPCPTSTVSAPGMSNVLYEISVGEEVKHPISGLRRGDAVMWEVEELQDLTVDLTVLIRSGEKVHAARRLRDTERVTRCRDTFEVDADYSDKQLPLTLEIQISNAFSWGTAKRVQLLLCHRVAGPKD